MILGLIGGVFLVLLVAVLVALVAGPLEDMCYCGDEDCDCEESS